MLFFIWLFHRTSWILIEHHHFILYANKTLSIIVYDPLSLSSLSIHSNFAVAKKRGTRRSLNYSQLNCINARINWLFSTMRFTFFLTILPRLRYEEGPSLWGTFYLHMSLDKNTATWLHTDARSNVRRGRDSRLLKWKKRVSVTHTYSQLPPLDSVDSIKKESRVFERWVGKDGYVKNRREEGRGLAGRFGRSLKLNSCQFTCLTCIPTPLQFLISLCPDLDSKQWIGDRWWKLSNWNTYDEWFMTSKRGNRRMAREGEGEARLNGFLKERWIGDLMFSYNRTFKKTFPWHVFITRTRKDQMCLKKKNRMWWRAKEG